MGAAALEEGELDAADLGAGLFFHDGGQQRSQTAELGMAEAVGSAGLGFRDEAAVSVVDTLGDCDYAVALLLIYTGGVGKELVHVEVSLRQVNEVGPAADEAGKSGAGREPAGVAAHDLNYDYHARVVDMRVLVDLGAGGGDVLRRAAEAGAVVGVVEVIVDGLGHAHDAAFITALLHETAYLVAGVHGVVAAVIEEVAHVILLEYLKNTLVVGVIFFGIGHLVAAGAELGGGGVHEQAELVGILLAHVVELVLEHALDAVGGAVDLRDAVCVKRSPDDAVGAGVDDGGRTSGLTYDTGSPECFFHADTSKFL